jgi:hypothetical protein
MPQQRKALLDSLAALRRQIDETPNVDPALAQQLKATLADVEAELSESNPARSPKPKLTERLSAAAQDFEDSHPTLSGTVARLVDGLGGMGI